MVAIGTKTLDISDCSSVGWHHLVFAPVDGDRSGLVGAYLKRHLPVVDRMPEAPYYLIGAAVESEHEVDLGKVCVSFRGRINATPQWVLPIADEAELSLWRERVATGLCGRTPAP
jgi:hypothetical protein